MKELIDFLLNNPVGFLATIEDNKPRVRPLGFQFYEDNKFYFITANTKQVYNQLIKIPYAEFSCISQNWTIARLRGQTEFSDDISLKDRALENSPIAKNIYKTAHNPALELFYIHNGQAILFDLNGGEPRKFMF